MRPPDPAEPWAPQVGEGEGRLMHRILKFVMNPFRVESVLLTEGIILRPYHEIWE
jgi:hypothetical protein